jgi:hypothetical protein
MTGPYPPEYGAGPVGPQMYAAQPYPENVPSPYPSMLPPPLPYPKRRWWRPVGAVALVLAVVAALVTAIVIAARDDDASTHNGFTDASAKAAIQDYLDALSKGDDETVARHTLCGLFDSGDAFRKQYSRAEVTSIDKMVIWSPNQAQVLFTMRVAPATGSTRNQTPKNEEQAIAQLLSQDNEILVCSYLPRTAGQY